jgi:hypothetical protein
MAIANNRGWDFVKVGCIYQYKESPMLATVKVLEDNSTDEEYRFTFQVEECNLSGNFPDSFEVSHIKNLDGCYSGMMHIYESPEYTFTPKWIRK